MRPEHDFSRGERGVTARRDAQGGNPVVVSLDVLDVFPGVAARERQRRPVRTTPAGYTTSIVSISYEDFSMSIRDPHPSGEYGD